MELSTRRAKKLKWNKSSYRDLLSCKLPRRASKSTRRKKQQCQQKLFSVEVVEKQDSRVKVHYIGYSNDFDEWKDESEVEVVAVDSEDLEVLTVDKSTVYKPFSVYDELRIKIKRTLSCNRKVSPSIKITMPFDLVLFNGGLKSAAVPSKKIGGIQYYKIVNYQDLNHLLGANWHYRGININGDYGYVIKETLEFCIRKSRLLVEYVCSCSGDNSPIKSSIDTGHSLIFCFTCEYGNRDTFGKDRRIFV